MVAGVELTYNIGATALQMAQTIFGSGSTVVSASYTGDNRASAIYSDGDLAPGVVPGDTGVILSTGQAQGFTRNGPESNATPSQTTGNTGPNNDPDFNALAGRSTFDASFLEVEFIPDPGVTAMTIDFVFSSEEYPEFSNTIYNDIVGVWVDGAPVPLAVGNGNVSVSNVSPSNGENLFISNTDDQFNTEMDGFTVTLSLTFPVTPGEVNEIKIGVADVADSNYDSNLLIAADALQGTLIAIDDTGTFFPDGTRVIDLLGNDVNETGGTLVITHINGQPVAAGDTIALPEGQSVTLNADGTVTATTDSDLGQVAFTYTVTSSTGESDTGFVNYDTVPCFTAGTPIRTDTGSLAAEKLCPGDLVHTRDNGLQPLRWAGRRLVKARGKLAPIRIEAGCFGAHDRLLVSPLHRVLVRGPLAELYFGETEVLVAARDLINGRTVQRVEGGWVDYVHLLFDDHQVVWSAGLPTESFLPGPQTSGLFEADALDELRTLFPELDPTTGAGYGPAARRTLKAYEGSLLKPAA
ncbi:MAG: Hint domain-containing protein [Pseudomonadota bacterium]